VTFSLDASGMVSVTATASETGSTKEMRVEASSSLSRGEVDALRFGSAEGSSGDGMAVAPVAPPDPAATSAPTEAVESPTAPPEPAAFTETVESPIAPPEPAASTEAVASPIAPPEPPASAEDVESPPPEGAGILAESDDDEDTDDIDGADMWTAEADFEDGYDEELSLDDDDL